jgi:hypothetical protein
MVVTKRCASTEFDGGGPVPVITRSEAAIAAVTSKLTRPNDPGSVLADIVSYAVSCLDLVDAAIVAKDAAGELHALYTAPSDHATGTWADLHLSEPVTESVRKGTVIIVDDLVDDGHRWHAVREVLASVGVRGIRIYPVRVYGVPCGALVAFTAEPWGSVRSSSAGQTLADLAGLVLSQSPADRRQAVAIEKIVGLVESQVAINRAYGMLAEIGGTTIEAAASVLASYARFHRETQADVAGWLVADRSRVETVLRDPLTSNLDASTLDDLGV